MPITGDESQEELEMVLTDGCNTWCVLVSDGVVSSPLFALNCPTALTSVVRFKIVNYQIKFRDFNGVSLRYI